MLIGGCPQIVDALIGGCPQIAQIAQIVDAAKRLFST
jgi:hypothetical protein